MRAPGLGLILAMLPALAMGQVAEVPFGGLEHDATLPVEITSAVELDQSIGRLPRAISSRSSRPRLILG